MTITEFLEARIAEDEAIAREIAECESHDPAGQGYDGTIMQMVGSKRHGVITVDPARVLAECAAKRAIITSYRSCIEADAHTNITTEFGVKLTVSGMVKGLELAVKSLAAVYADHPDYRQEWTL